MTPLPTSSTSISDLRRVVIGTAGHIDHGKTQLVRVLTGVDCDRWEEEKKRGITIDLGFAQLMEGDLQIGFVDVPGHERFLHNALAGMGGIRGVLLVVAATEGVMPQTREHVAICSLLGIPSALVALTKVDLVTPDLLELAELEVDEFLEGSAFSGSRIVRVSSVTGEGIAELRSALVEMAGKCQVVVDLDDPPHLPIDRAFLLKGLGALVTGTLASGRIRRGQALEILPTQMPVRVRSLQVHGQAREEALAGERTSVQLAGTGLEHLSRGMRLVSTGAFAASHSLCLRLTLLDDVAEALEDPIPIRLHLYSSDVLGMVRPLSPSRIEPGEGGIVEVKLRDPMVAVRGDKVILRRPSPATTLGGGEVLDPGWQRRRGLDLVPALEALCGDSRAASLLWARDRREMGLEAGELARRLGRQEKQVTALLDEMTEAGELRPILESQDSPCRWLASSVYEQVRERAQRVLKEYFERDRLAPGIPKAEALRRILPPVPPHVSRVYLSWLEESGVLEAEGDLLVLPGRTVQLKGREAQLVADLRRRFEDAGFDPPGERELKEDYPGQREDLESALRFLSQEGHLRRLPNGALIATSTVSTVRDEILEGSWQRFSVAQFKEKFGLSRKWAIPLLEYFDSTGLTRRVDNERLVLRQSSVAVSRGI